eukprot:TRINITY_DN220_c0_g1_i1.p1 TRINITY_DN220_c0_g1~~TRINITY_DN220_c0_g1_i1.p1  ORF type:complete len:167 (-),score=42.39 TRINITY_DN220_c0_g1_i1:158-658(-)
MQRAVALVLSFAALAMAQEATIAYTYKFFDNCDQPAQQQWLGQPNPIVMSSYVFNGTLTLDSTVSMNNTFNNKLYDLGKVQRNYPVIGSSTATVSFRLRPDAPLGGKKVGQGDLFTLLLIGHLSPSDLDFSKAGFVEMIHNTDYRIRCSPMPVDCGTVCAQIKSIP